MTVRSRRIPIALAAAALVSGSAMAQMTMPSAAPGAPASDFTFSANVGIFSEYVFRGVSQTNEKPALQGGLDLAHKSGLYIGTWGSNVSWISDADPRVSASLEWDMYGGYKGTLPYGFGYDLGVMYYYYPGSYPPDFVKPDTLELYAGLSWKWLSLKYSYSADNKTFGFPDSRGSDYWDLTASYDVVEKVNDAIGKVNVMGHVGRQRFKNNGDFDYTDWKVGASMDVYGVTLGLFYSDTNAHEDMYTNAFGKKIANSRVVGYIQKTF